MRRLAAVFGEPASGPPVPGRRVLQLCLGLIWLLDAGLQFQPYMFGPFFVTQTIELGAAGSPAPVAGSVNWAGHLMLQHIAVYNAIFAVIQLIIACGLFFRGTVRLALAASIAWSLCVWWFGESLGGIFTGASPLAGFPGGVVLYALIAVLLWPTRSVEAGQAGQNSTAASGILGARWANVPWILLWGSFSYFLLLPVNRDPDAIGQLFANTDGEPGWLVSVMSALGGAAAHRGTVISVVLAVGCAVAAVGIALRPAVRLACVLAIAVAVFAWLAEGLGGIFTGQGTDPNTGPLLVLLAACYWPRNPVQDKAGDGVPMMPDGCPSTRLVTGS